MLQIVKNPDTRDAGGSMRDPSPRWALAALALSMLMSSLGTSIANVALPTLATTFGISFQQVQWVVIAYLLSITTLIVGAGRLGDIVGRRRLLLVGLALFTVASMLCGVAPSLGWLIAARAIQGVGAAILMALTMAFVGDIMPKDRTGSAMGVLGTMSAVGTALGPSLGGLLIAGLGWQSIFLINLPLGIATLAIAYRTLPADRAPAPGRGGFDAWGTLVLAVTLAAYALAMTLGRGDFGLLNIALLIAAAFGVAVFVRVEMRVASPLVSPATFRDPVLSASMATNMLVSTVMMSTLVVGPFYLSGALGLAPVPVGLVLSIAPVVTASSGMPAGYLADRFGARRVTYIGLGTLIVGCCGLSVTPLWLGIPGYVGPLIVATIGYALFQTANNTAVMSGVPADRRGVVSGMLNLSRSLGLVTGASAMGAVFAFASAAGDVVAADPHAVASGMRTTYAVAAGLIVAALVIAFAAGRSRQRDQQD